ncbi:hypothetical protein ACFW9N_40400 [Streptomyces sp. NPDC059496]|uniref:hypothetical protein n=1 Tax=Streptomyces sp. NPDC059496 TaxID=3346851 RepID=UPI00367AE65F
MSARTEVTAWTWPAGAQPAATEAMAGATWPGKCGSAAQGSGNARAVSGAPPRQQVSSAARVRCRWGLSGAEYIKWRADQRALIDAGRWDLAMRMDVDEVREQYGDTYDTHIADMVESLEVNKEFQKMLEMREWTIDHEVLK